MNRAPAEGVRDALPGISACLIVRDEEAFLDACLASIAGAVDEICLVDTGSTDGTIAIAERYGARIERVAWRDDFGWARNVALAMATRRWCFVLDADERLDPESVAPLRTLGASPPDGRGRWIEVRNLTDVIRGAGATTNRSVRLFPNDPAIRYRGRIHEVLARDDDPAPLDATPAPIAIVHHGYLAEVLHGREKGERNLRLARVAAEADPGDPHAWFNFGMSLMLAGQRDAALDALERVRALTATTPRGFRPQTLLAIVDLRMSRSEPEEALEAADACVAIVPTLADAHFARGRALAALGRRQEAREAYGAAIAAGAHQAEHYVTDGEIAVWKAASEIAGSLMEEGRHAEALRWIERALEARPAAQPLVINRARCLEALGDLAAAEVAFAAAAAAYRDRLAVVEYINFLLRRAPAERALAALDAALPLLDEGDRRLFLATAGAVAWQAGDQARGLAYGRAALAIEPRFEGIAAVEAIASHYRLPAYAAAVTNAE